MQVDIAEHGAQQISLRGTLFGGVKHTLVQYTRLEKTANESQQVLVSSALLEATRGGVFICASARQAHGGHRAAGTASAKIMRGLPREARTMAASMLGCSAAC